MSDPSMTQPSSNGISGQAKVGIVVDNNDPQKLGRVRVRVAELFEGIPDEHLPWAVPVLAHPGGATPNSGLLDIPIEGSKLLVEFQNGSLLHPRYAGYIIDKTTQLQEGLTNYPDRRVMLLPNGTMLIVDRKTNDVYVRAVGKLNLYVTGDCYTKVDGNLVQHIAGDRLTKVDGNDYTVVGGVSGTYAANLNLKSSGTTAVTGSGQLAMFSGGVASIKGSQFQMQSGSDAAGSAPAVPNMPAWDGIRQPTPS